MKRPPFQIADSVWHHLPVSARGGAHYYSFTWWPGRCGLLLVPPRQVGLTWPSSPGAYWAGGPHLAPPLTVPPGLLHLPSFTRRPGQTRSLFAHRLLLATESERINFAAATYLPVGSEIQQRELGMEVIISSAITSLVRG